MRPLKQNNSSFAGFSEQVCAGLRILFFSAFLTAVFFSTNSGHGAMDLADQPMMTSIKPAPANIMILLDDSDSMTFESSGRRL
jgi:hypothetical protein